MDIPFIIEYNEDDIYPIKDVYFLDGVPVTTALTGTTATYISSKQSNDRPHMHEYIQVLYVDQGSPKHTIFDTTHRMSPREVALVPAMHMHNVTACDRDYRMAGCDIFSRDFTASYNAGPWSFDNICLTPLSVSAIKKVPFLTVREETAQELSSLFDECFDLTFSDAKDLLLLRGKTVELMSLVASEFSHCEGELLGSSMAGYCPSLYRAMHCIHKGFREELNIDQIARDAMLQERTLYRLFNGCMDTTILQYVTRLRLHHAKRLLSETDRILSDIAADSGFGHTSTFHRQFLRHTGMSPTHYRELYSVHK